MRIIPIITHPVLVLVLFCFTLISGEHFGGLYLLYILMAIPHGGIHATLAILGAGLILYSYIRHKRQSKMLLEPLLNIPGVLLLYISLLLFLQNSWSYNRQTFEQAIPILSFVLFGVISLGFLLHCLLAFNRQRPESP